MLLNIILALHKGSNPKLATQNCPSYPPQETNPWFKGKSLFLVCWVMPSLFGGQHLGRAAHFNTRGQREERLSLKATALHAADLLFQIRKFSYPNTSGKLWQLSLYKQEVRRQPSVSALKTLPCAGIEATQWPGLGHGEVFGREMKEAKPGVKQYQR